MTLSHPWFSFEIADWHVKFQSDTSYDVCYVASMIVVVLVAVYDDGWYPVGKEPRPYTTESLPKLTKVRSLIGYEMQIRFARVDGTFALMSSCCTDLSRFEFLLTSVDCILIFFSN